MNDLAFILQVGGATTGLLGFLWLYLRGERLELKSHDEKVAGLYNRLQASLTSLKQVERANTEAHVELDSLRKSNLAYMQQTQNDAKYINEANTLIGSLHDSIANLTSAKEEYRVSMEEMEFKYSGAIKDLGLKLKTRQEEIEKLSEIAEARKNVIADLANRIETLSRELSDLRAERDAISKRLTDELDQRIPKSPDWGIGSKKGKRR